MVRALVGRLSPRWVAGLVCLALAGTSLTGSLLQQPALAGLGFEAPAPSIASCVLLMMLVLAWLAAGAVRRIAAGLVAAAAVLVALDQAVGPGLGAGWWPDAPNADTRLGPSFEMAIGAALLAATQWRRPAGRERWAALGAAALCGTSLVERLLDVEGLFGVPLVTHLSLAMAIGMLILVFPLWLEQRNPLQTLAPEQEARRIIRVGGLVLMVVAALIGCGGLIALKSSAADALRANLLTALTGMADELEQTIDRSVALTRFFASRPALIPIVGELGMQPDSPAARAFLAREVGAMKQDDIRGIAITGADGRPFERAGRLVDAASFHWPLVAPIEAAVVWQDDLVLHTRAPLLLDGRLVGYLVLERALPQLRNRLTRAAGWSDSADGGICGLETGPPAGMACFPNRQTPTLFRNQLYRDGRPLPMAHALLGERGTIEDRDFRGRPVIAAFTPVGTYGLGMAMKVDSYDLYGPIRARIRLILPVLALLVIGGTALLHAMVAPLARRLVASESEARAASLALGAAKSQTEAAYADLAATEMRIAQTERRLRDAIDNMPAGLLLWDAEDRLVLCNAAVARVQPDGLAHMVIGRRYEDILRDRVRAGVVPVAASREEAFIAERVAVHRKAEGRFREHQFSDGRWLRILERRTGDGGIVSIGTDVTDEKRAADELNHAKEAAEAAARAKSRFLAMMSHEIRTPMTGIIGFAELVLSGDLTDDQRRKLSYIRDASHALLAILNDLLDFSKMEAGKLSLQPAPFELAPLIEGCQAIISPLALEKGLAVVAAPMPAGLPARVVGDAARLRQILLNLLNNAVKFTEAGRVAIAVSAQPDGKLLFAVSDTGIGIAEDQQRHLFKEFSQLGSQDRGRFAGTGLGLAISKRLAQMMGGEIGVTSSLGQGSSFWFTVNLPAAEPAVTEPIRQPIAEGSRAERASLRILVVDDVAMNRELAGAILESAGHRPVFAEDGAQAVARVESDPFDLILMDVHMPVLDGLEATAAIRAMAEPIASTPILAMTAGVIAEELEHCRAAGMDGHVAKPFEVDTLLATVERHGRAQRRAAAAAAG